MRFLDILRDSHDADLISMVLYHSLFNVYHSLFNVYVASHDHKRFESDYTVTKKIKFVGDGKIGKFILLREYNEYNTTIANLLIHC